MEFISNFSNNHLLAKPSCLNELNQAQAPNLFLEAITVWGVPRGTSLGFLKVWGHSFENESPMCIPLASCPELCHLFNCYRTFHVYREEPWPSGREFYIWRVKPCVGVLAMLPTGSKILGKAFPLICSSIIWKAGTMIPVLSTGRVVVRSK